MRLRERLKERDCCWKGECDGRSDIRE